jgi:drug/metabolite transporter (DMT)-like permease
MAATGSLQDTRGDRLGLFLGLIGITAFAGSLPATRVAVIELDPWFVTSARATIAGVSALVILMILRRPLPPKSTWLPLLFVALGVVLGFPLFTGIAMQTAPASHGGVLIGILPLATAIAAALLAHERPGKLFWIAGVAGAAIVVGFALRHGGLAAFGAADLLLFAAIASASIGYTVSGKLARTMPGWEVISWAVVLALPVFSALTWLLWPADIAAVGLRTWTAMVYVGIVSQFLGFFAWNAGLAMGGIARVGQVQLLQPFITIAMAAVVNHEPVEFETLAFAAAVAATVLIGLRSRARPIAPAA